MHPESRPSSIDVQKPCHRRLSTVQDGFGQFQAFSTRKLTLQTGLSSVNSPRRRRVELERVGGKRTIRRQIGKYVLLSAL